MKRSNKDRETKKEEHHDHERENTSKEKTTTNRRRDADVSITCLSCGRERLTLLYDMKVDRRSLCAREELRQQNEKK
jgi:hypothetical protein